ncbi:Ubiquinol-cytochrome C reductase iron-sulfur subunit [Carbonactinospora thermoautotrophica]|uniref:Cytochrome bc1 complex Rieske iron-sulfur subunit n=2 Tax=Carbonactinospora thermoautotrophica TaxID=1469144 RepID=A0A132MV05_9ACTN|nr:Rieske 2Fe-2S domain-containing protein [Carbonactinospora thermoautotrophica]KWX01681.1 Ubiquinol-cytochrome C reductase iron-sulfur subunit [Carbonactinospora thermoautotrophica]
MSDEKLPAQPGRSGDGGQSVPPGTHPASETTAPEPGDALAGTGPFPDPGLPPHQPRLTDVDKRAAKRAERQVATLFGISILSTIAFIVCYFAIPEDLMVRIFPIGKVQLSNFALGTTLGLALFCIGAGAIHWARTLMPDEEIVEQRHYPLRSSEADRAAAIEAFNRGAEESGIGRRPLIRRTLVGALAAFPLSLVVPLWGLANRSRKPSVLAHTAWAKSKLIINENTHQPIRPADLTLNTLVFGYPEGVEDLNELAKASILLVRLQPEDIKDPREREWAYEGIVAFSKICTHVGCPVGLYEQTTHHLLCPCHQSTFDLADGAKVVFGPAGRPLPQLKLAVNEEGYLVAAQDFAEPVGPSYPERER